MSVLVLEPAVWLDGLRRERTRLESLLEKSEPLTRLKESEASAELAFS